MKKLFTLSLVVVSTLFTHSQPPQVMSYQGVVRDNGGELIAKQVIGVRTSILKGSPIQIIVFQETYSPNPSTNENGLLTLAIGSGTASIGNFSSIDWSSGPYFLATEIDPKGGTNYTITGQSQILSVPYALYSEVTGPLAAGKVTGITQNFVPRSNGTGLVTGTIFDNGTQVGIGNTAPDALLHLRNYEGPQLIIGSNNQPTREWNFTVNPTAGFSLINENLGSPFTALHFQHKGTEAYIGIGTTSPGAKLDVNGQIRITGGTPAAGEVLTTNSSGLATWEPIPEPAVNHIYFEVKLTTDYNWPMNATTLKIDFSTGSMVWENQGNAFNTSTSTFTAPEDGIYSFRGSIHFKSITAGNLIYAFLKAGNKNYNGCWRNANGTEEIIDIDMTLYLAKDETAQLWGYVNDATPPGIVSGNVSDDYALTFFSGAKVR